MLDSLQVGSPVAVEPKKMERTVPALPAAIAKAYDDTPLGEARKLPITLGAEVDRTKISTTLVRLLKLYATSQGSLAFKVGVEVVEAGVELYWQKRAPRKAAIRPVEAAAQSEPTVEKKKQGKEGR